MDKNIINDRFENGNLIDSKNMFKLNHEIK